MEIRTERLALRPMAMEYLDSVHAYAADPENTRFMAFLPNDTLEETMQFIRDAEAQWQSGAPVNREFIILLGQKPIGGIGLCLLDAPDTAEIGWILNKAYWGHGYAVEAARALVDCAVRRWGVRRFIAHCDAENRGSWRVMEKLGMRRVSCTGGRKNRSSDEERLEYMYELIAE